MTTNIEGDELREKLLAVDTVYQIGKDHTTQFLLPEYYLQRLIVFIQSEISKREQLLLSRLVKKAVYYTADKLEADGLDKWAVPVSFINAKRKT